MIAFFDTSVHVALLRGALAPESALSRTEGAVRLSPVVASELLRGSSGRARRAVERMVDQLVPLEPPSWRDAFLEAGRLLPRVFATHEAIGVARLQNDVLLALSARHTGARLITLDRHFQAIRKHVPFRLVLLDA